LEKLVSSGCQIVELLVGLDYAESELSEQYYGSMCAGVLGHDRQNEELEMLYDEAHEYLEKAIQYFPNDDTAFIRGLLEDLTPKQNRLYVVEEDPEPSYKPDPRNLLLPFPDIDYQ
jgi:hypothetical protein